MREPPTNAPAVPPVPARIERVKDCSISFFRYLYAEVGRAYHWWERLAWSDEQIRRYVAQPGLTFWVMYCDGVPAGYFELKKAEDRSVELAYFGLLPEFIGKGLGRYLLEVAIQKGWEAGPTRMWLHTCTLDHPSALGNYKKRGFQPYREERYVTEIETERG